MSEIEGNTHESREVIRVARRWARMTGLTFTIDPVKLAHFEAASHRFNLRDKAEHEAPSLQGEAQ